MEPDVYADPKLDAVLSRLERVKRRPGGWWGARCPAHDDRGPSLGVKLGDRAIVLSCLAGCSVDSIRQALGLEWADLRLEGAARRVRRPFDRRGAELEALMAADELGREPDVLERFRQHRGWAGPALHALGVGWDGERLTLPVYDEHGKLHDVLRYDPFNREGRWKMLAGPGRSRLPWPAPERVDNSPGENAHLYLVEGEGSVLSMASIGLRAVALPGSAGKPSWNAHRPASFQGAGWHRAWARRFVPRFPRIVCVPDCDTVGRALMQTAARDLNAQGGSAVVLDLGLSDGLDVGDFLRTARTGRVRRLAKDLLLAASYCARLRPDELPEAQELLRAWMDWQSSEGADSSPRASEDPGASAPSEGRRMWDWGAAA